MLLLALELGVAIRRRLRGAHGQSACLRSSSQRPLTGCGTTVTAPPAGMISGVGRVGRRHEGRDPAPLSPEVTARSSAGRTPGARARRGNPSPRRQRQGLRLGRPGLRHRVERCRPARGPAAWQPAVRSGHLIGLRPSRCRRRLHRALPRRSRHAVVAFPTGPNPPCRCA